MTVTVVHIAKDKADDSSCALNIHVNTNEPSSSFYLAPPSRTAASGWISLLSCCSVPVFRNVASLRTATTPKEGEQENQRRNALNGKKPLVYWILDELIC